MSAQEGLIVVAEDDRLYQGYVSKALRDAGYLVEICGDGDAALARLQRGPQPELLLTDFRMPGRDGLGLLREVRENWPQLPVVLMTSYGQDHKMLREALKLGCQGFIEKPFKVSEVTETVAQTIAQHGAPTTSAAPQDRLDNFEVLAEVARGAMGIVYKARQRDLDRIVALKVPHDGDARPLGDEARAMAQLRHPNLAVVYEVGRSGKLDYFTMEFVPGDTLAQRLRQGPLPAAEALGILAPVADGLAHAHTLGILHRDLKPANLVIDPSGRSTLIDFGIATWKGTSVGPEDEGYIWGTLPYMAPEYISGEEYDEQCEVYALGVVLYESLSGHLRFPAWQGLLPEGNQPAAMALRLILTKPISVGERTPGLPARVVEVVDRAVHADPEVRYGTMRELADALQSAQAG